MVMIKSLMVDSPNIVLYFIFSDDGVFSGFDVNGNPIEKLYSQMRERPLNQEASAFNSGNSGYKSYGATSSDNTLSNPISPQEPSHATENKAKIGNKKGKQKREEPVVLAENVENYQGHKDLEELVKFIEQNDIKENQVKKSNGSSDVKLNDKLVKKAKDKKSKQTVGIVPSVPKPGDHIVIDIELELPPPPTDVMGNSSEKLPPNDEIPNEKIEKNVKPQDCEKSVTQKNKAFIENDVKSKNKTSTKNETTPSDKKPKNTTPGKKEVKEAKVNGFNHGIESLDAGVTKEHDKKVKESTKKTSAANKTPESVNDKKKANKLQIDTVTNDKQMVNCSKSPGEIKSPLPTSPVSTKSEANDFDSGNYIFTDIPVSHVEPEFTIVNKKKKKPIAHVIQSKDQLPFMAGISREFPVTRPKYRENYSQSVPRSVTPPPTKSRDKSQDFSLSAFPALSNSLVSKDKSNPLEARRSSIGDLPLAGETSSLDDSDIASVRSLPAAQAGRLLELASSRFQKSYANIAASSKPVGQSSPDTSYEECSGESPEKPKQTVWKGSLTERRHSIGSSPDDGKLLESSSGLTDSSRQKSGSQEVIKTENNPTSKTSDTANINLSPSSGVSKQKPYHQDIENSKNQMCDKLVNTETETTNVREGSVPHQPAEPNNQSELSQSTMSSSSVSPSKYDLPIQPFDVSRFDRKSTNKTTASSSAHAVVNRSPVSFTGNSVVNMRQSPGRNEQVETSVSSVNIKSSSPLSSNDMRSQSVVSLKSVKNKTLVPKIPTNGRKNKSVVFLDKRDVPSNLDITFGFDDITESRPTLTNNIENMSAKNNTTSVKNKSTPKNDPEVVSTNVSVSQPNNRNRETVTTPTYVVNPSDLQPGHVFTQTLLENDKQGGQFVPNYNTVKSLKDHVNLLNGVVKNVGQRVGNQQQTLTNETPNGNRSTVSTLQTNPNEGNVPISHDNQPIVGKEKIMCSPVVENNGPSSTVVVEDKKMVIYYGDAMVNNDDCVHSGGDNNTKSIQFVFSSKNINCGKFNHNEAVTQLKKEWDRVMELKSKTVPISSLSLGRYEVICCQSGRDKITRTVP
ncbi:hypothetical protein LOTGIDRAFT_238396 [Lottia gigantea]|uniref:Uncharacterized protein n=1 Tax=Lottia gigantea TaxID=225164 RepID=V4B4T4_LOTGI|nr:hypothetical protein LOTGIDRAFT_238396 [Lottia gigantea]ESP00982.1 hypothetical protein LOTGIDRAFT_238396 [Lottia gigantea]